MKRQQEEKALAQEELDRTLAESGNISKETEDYIRRRANIELMKKGVVPLTPVEDLSEAEQAEIDAALSAEILE